MTSSSTPDPKREREREPGYRGSLPPREDRLARPWILAVLGIFVLIVLLSIAGVPSRFIPEPTPLPVPSVTPAPSVAASAEPSESASTSASAEESASAGASPSVEASASP